MQGLSPPFAALPDYPTPGHSAKGAWKYRMNSQGDPHCARAAPLSCCALEKTPWGLLAPTPVVLQRLNFGSGKLWVALAKLQPQNHTVPQALPLQGWDFGGKCGWRPLLLTSLLQHSLPSPPHQAECTCCSPVQEQLVLSPRMLLTQLFLGVFVRRHNFLLLPRDVGQYGATRACTSGM